MTAEIRGRIALSDDGCVYLQGPGLAKNDVIWPAGYTAEVSANRRLTLRNPGGEPVAHEGTRISSGDGGFSEDEGGNVPDDVCEVADDSVLVIHDVLPPL